MFKAIMTALILARFILQRSWAPHGWLERARRARRPSLERAGSGRAELGAHRWNERARRAKP